MIPVSHNTIVIDNPQLPTPSLSEEHLDDLVPPLRLFRKSRKPVGKQRGKCQCQGKIRGGVGRNLEQQGAMRSNRWGNSLGKAEHVDQPLSLNGLITLRAKSLSPPHERSLPASHLRRMSRWDSSPIPVRTKGRIQLSKSLSSPSQHQQQQIQGMLQAVQTYDLSPRRPSRRYLAELDEIIDSALALNLKSNNKAAANKTQKKFLTARAS